MEWQLEKVLGHGLTKVDLKMGLAQLRKHGVQVVVFHDQGVTLLRASGEKEHQGRSAKPNMYVYMVNYS